MIRSYRTHPQYNLIAILVLKKKQITHLTHIYTKDRKITNMKEMQVTRLETEQLFVQLYIWNLPAAIKGDSTEIISIISDKVNSV